MVVVEDGRELCDLDFTEAIRDSPRFRYDLSRHEKYYERVQKRLDETAKLVRVAAELSKSYVSALFDLTASVNGLWADLDVGEESQPNREAIAIYKAISDALSHTANLNKQLAESAYPVLQSAIDSFIRTDLGKLNEARNQFSSLSTSLSEALTKKAAINKTRAQEMQDARDQLTAIATCFAHNSLDYVAIVNTLHARKLPLLLEALWSFVGEFAASYARGHRYFDEKGGNFFQRDSGMQKLDALKGRADQVEKRMHADYVRMMPNEVLFQQPAGLPMEDGVMMEGYLFKRATNAFKKWNRRWFMIKEDKLLYSHKTLDGAAPTVMEDNLKLCLVRPAPPTIERACCFELVTPSRNHLLQADSEALCAAWIRALQRTIQHLHESDDHRSHLPASSRSTSFLHDAYSSGSRHRFCGNGSGDVESGEDALKAAAPEVGASGGGGGSVHPGPSSSTTTPLTASGLNGHSGTNSVGSRSSTLRSSRSASSSSMYRPLPVNDRGRALSFVKELLCIAGNEKCADCECPEAKWASINLGVVICIECSGAHRSLGVHKSKVRSLTMDNFELEQRNVLLRLGNKKSNSIFLAHLPADAAPISPGSSREARERWIVAKYVDRKFVGSEQAKSLGGLQPRSISLNEMSNYGITHYNSPYFSNNLHIPSPSSTQLRVEAECPSQGESEERGSQQSRLTVGSEMDISTSSSTEKEAALEPFKSGDLEAVLKLMAAGMDLNSPLFGTYPLHLAVENNQSTLLEFLLLNDARASNLDEDLNTALHVAAKYGRTFQVCQLLKRNTLQGGQKLNRDNKTPLNLAEEGRFADIVTLLRLVELRSKEIADELSSTMDETVDTFIAELTARHNQGTG